MSLNDGLTAGVKALLDRTLKPGEARANDLSSEPTKGAFSDAELAVIIAAYNATKNQQRVADVFHKLSSPRDRQSIISKQTTMRGNGQLEDYAAEALESPSKRKGTKRGAKAESAKKETAMEGESESDEISEEFKPPAKKSRLSSASSAPPLPVAVPSSPPSQGPGSDFYRIFSENQALRDELAVMEERVNSLESILRPVPFKDNVTGDIYMMAPRIPDGTGGIQMEVERADGDPLKTYWKVIRHAPKLEDLKKIPNFGNDIARLHTMNGLADNWAAFPMHYTLTVNAPKGATQVATSVMEDDNDTSKYKVWKFVMASSKKM
jgi:hypothetical protein